MKKEMKAIGFTKDLPIDNPESLFEFTTTVPKPRPKDLIVKVEAVSVNPVDIFTRQRQKETLSEPKIIGYDAYGTVVEVGTETSLFKPGDKVFYAGAYNRPGSDSEYQAVDERIVGHAPKTLSSAQIAAMPLTSLTAWEALFEQMEIKLAEVEKNQAKSILIINGAGGVGSIATQLAHLAGLTVIATAGNSTTKAWELEQGVDYAVDYHHNLVDQVHELGFQQVDYILELQDLDSYWSAITALIAPFGVVVSTTGSGKNLDFSSLKHRMVKFGWEWMYAKSWYQTPNLISQHEILDQVSHLLDEGILKSTLTQTLAPINAANLREATKLVAGRQMLGKVVVQNDSAK